MSNSKLYTFWLPMVDFTEMHRKLKEKKVQAESGIHLLEFTYLGQSIIIDSMGFFYIETN